MLAYDYPLMGVFWSMMWFFLWIIMADAAVPRDRRHFP